MPSQSDKPHAFDEIPAGGVHRPPFAYEYILGRVTGSSSGHFRIHDANDNALCFCYSEENAKEVVQRLNASAPSAERASPHQAMEYDGAFMCSRCGAKWGALPGDPKAPAECVASHVVPSEPVAWRYKVHVTQQDWFYSWDRPTHIDERLAQPLYLAPSASAPSEALLAYAQHRPDCNGGWVYKDCELVECPCGYAQAARGGAK